MDDCWLDAGGDDAEEEEDDEDDDDGNVDSSKDWPRVIILSADFADDIIPSMEDGELISLNP